MALFDCFRKKPDPAERPNPVQGSEVTQMYDPIMFRGSKKGEKRLWYPPALQHERRMKKVWSHAGNYPKGLVVHFNAGRHNPSNTIEGGIKNGYLYDAMGPDGIIRQANPLSDAGYHTGSGPWKGPDGRTYSPMHRFCRGVEITSAGKLDSSGKSWFGVSIPSEKIREVKKGTSIRESGKYEAYTKEQEESLVLYCLWLKWNNPTLFDFDWVIGHEECSVHKTDPGGALSCDMPTLRLRLKLLYALLESMADEKHLIAQWNEMRG